MSQILNPYLPEYEYIPDGEPHVFGDRVYVYGSHDRFDGKKFCLNDYVSYSASVEDLTNWRYEGVIYKKTQDPRMPKGDHEMWAPDVVHGKDGRYYLYYCPDDRIRSIGVAVCDEPAGHYQFLGVVRDLDGGIIGEREGDTIQFDPGVFIDDDGEIYLYSGNGPRVRRDIGKEPKASVVMRLEDDMITIKEEPKKLLPSLGEADGTDFEGHEFFEASSIRKVNGKYYLVYSSVLLHQLCYAVSNRPDGPYAYGGVIISNSSIFEGTDRTDAHFPWGNDHGGIEKIGDKWYIFYHRQTNRTNFSRQGCAEEIQILPDGSIPQVEMTSQGLNGGPLLGTGTYPASSVCELYGKKPQVISHPLAAGMRHPFLTQTGPDVSPDDPGEKPRQFITNVKDGVNAVFRYFDMQDADVCRVVVRGKGQGVLSVIEIQDGEEILIGQSVLPSNPDWIGVRIPITPQPGICQLKLSFMGKGKYDILEFTLEKE